jgi:hypothetical protein
VHSLLVLLGHSVQKEINVSDKDKVELDTVV